MADGDGGGPVCDWCGDTNVLDGYGFFPGGDPHQFSPDPECSTEAERAYHAAACEEWKRTGKFTERPTEFVSALIINGSVAEVHCAGFGLGSYQLTPCPACHPEESRHG